MDHFPVLKLLASCQSPFCEASWFTSWPRLACQSCSFPCFAGEAQLQPLCDGCEHMKTHDNTRKHIKTDLWKHTKIHENTWKHINTEPSLVILLELAHFLVLVLWSSHQDFFTDGTMPSTSHQLLSRFSHINMFQNIYHIYRINMYL